MFVVWEVTTHRTPRCDTVFTGKRSLSVESDCCHVQNPTSSFNYVNLYLEVKESWLRHCTTSQKVAGAIPDGVIGIFPLT